MFLGSNRLFSVVSGEFYKERSTFCRQNATTLWRIESRQLGFNAIFLVIAKCLGKWRKIS